MESAIRKSQDIKQFKETIQGISYEELLKINFEPVNNLIFINYVKVKLEYNPHAMLVRSSRCFERFAINNQCTKRRF